jgi:hypothetical protein
MPDYNQGDVPQLVQVFGDRPFKTGGGIQVHTLGGRQVQARSYPEWMNNNKKVAEFVLRIYPKSLPEWVAQGTGAPPSWSRRDQRLYEKQHRRALAWIIVIRCYFRQGLSRALVLRRVNTYLQVKTIRKWRGRIIPEQRHLTKRELDKIIRQILWAGEGKRQDGKAYRPKNA